MSGRQQVSVQALDGRWHFGPAEIEEQMRRAPKGAFASAADATQASARATVEDPDATSLTTKQVTKLF